MRGRVSSAGGRRPQGIDSPDTIEEGKAMTMLRERPQDLRTRSYLHAVGSGVVDGLESETKLEMIEEGAGLGGGGVGFGGEGAGIGDPTDSMTGGDGEYCHDKDPFPVSNLLVCPIFCVGRSKGLSSCVTAQILQQGWKSGLYYKFLNMLVRLVLTPNGKGVCGEVEGVERFVGGIEWRGL